MKTFTAVALVASVLANVAHSIHLNLVYLAKTNISLDIFEYLTANGQEGAAYQNICKNTNYNSP